MIDKAVKLSVIEVLLGSIIHALYIPLAGHLLSLNQGAFLCSFLERNKTRAQNFKMLFEISIVTSTMKAFSPAGKKLGPMISISVQGFLFGIGILMGGNQILGQCLAMAFLSLWAFIQPFVTYYLMFGSELLSAFSYFSEKIMAFLPESIDSIYIVIFALVSGKALMAILIPFIIKKISLNKIKGLIQNGQTLHNPQNLSTFQGVVKDLTRPLFLMSLLLMVSYFLFTNTDYALILWKALRAIGVASILFYLTRSKYVMIVCGWLGTKNRYIKRINYLSSLALKRFFQSVSDLN